MRILIIGKNSFIAKNFIALCADSNVEFFSCSHSNIPHNFNPFDCVVNFTINPHFYTDNYSEKIDQDVIIATKVSAYKSIKYIMISSRMVFGRNELLMPMLETSNTNEYNNNCYGKTHT